MHELSITEQILKQSLQAVREKKASRIREIRLVMGPFCGLVPECIQMYLDVLAKGTEAEGAVIKARILPLKVLCRDCGRESEITRTNIRCPYCGGVRLKKLSGSEFMIESLEADINGDQGTASGDGMEPGRKPAGTADTGRETGLHD